MCSAAFKDAVLFSALSESLLQLKYLSCRIYLTHTYLCISFPPSQRVGPTLYFRIFLLYCCVVLFNNHKWTCICSKAIININTSAILVLFIELNSQICQFNSPLKECHIHKAAFVLHLLYNTAFCNMPFVYMLH